MTYDYSKLRGRVVEKCGTLTHFREKMGLSDRTVSAKFNGLSEWKQSEIVRACEILEIPATDINAYFFNIKVQDNEQ